MVAARKLIEDALRGPMTGIGWTPRAAGWFTRPIEMDKQGAIALAIASEHTAPGTATATLHVHLRDETVEAVVAEVCGLGDAGYRTTTAATSIGYLMPAGAWREWLVTPQTADSVAGEMTAAAHDYATPHLSRWANDPNALLQAVEASPTTATPGGLCRTAILLVQLGDREGAVHLLDQRLSRLEGRTDTAAELHRKMDRQLRRWLSTSGG